MRVTSGVDLNDGIVEAHEEDCPCLDCEDLGIPFGMFRPGDFLLLRDGEIVELFEYDCTCRDHHRSGCCTGWWLTTESSLAWGIGSDQFNDMRTLRKRLGNRKEMDRGRLQRLLTVMHLRRFRRYCTRVEDSVLDGPESPWASLNGQELAEFLKRLKKLACLVKAQQKVLNPFLK
jgi:hypothetical protein